MNTPPTQAQLRLIEQTYAAFKDAPRPRIDQITDCGRGSGCGECNDIRDEFAPFAARQLPTELIHKKSDALPLLTPMALRYYLPRFIAFSILPSPRDSFAKDVVLYHLCPKKPHETYFAERFAMFGASERSAIANYLATRRTSEDIDYHIEMIDTLGKIWGPGMPVV